MTGPLEVLPRIRAAIESRRAKGVEVRAHCWGVYWEPLRMEWTFVGSACACALGCLLLEEQPPVVDSGTFTDQAKAACLLLDAKPSEVDALIDGFDGLEYRPEDHDLDWYVVGLILRKDYVEVT